MKKVFLVIISLVFLHFSSNSQDNKLYQKGLKFFEEGQFAAAVDFFEQAYAKDTSNFDLTYKLGLAYLNSTYKKKALKYLLKAEKMSSKPALEHIFQIGHAYHVVGLFDKAEEYYKKSDPNNINKKHVTKALGECEFAKTYIANPIKYEIANLGHNINTQLPEYFPHITSDFQQMYFTGRRPDSKGAKLDVDGIYFEDIYMSLNRGGDWQAPTTVNSLNSEGHDACIGLSKDGQVMYVYKGTNGGDIYVSELNGDSWGTPKPVPFNTEFFESSVSISADGKKMFFVRKQANNKDILYCTKSTTGNWSKPIKLPFNTEYDEESPFIHDDGKTLYFSSKGHSTMGGFDIFKTVYGAGGWSKPENLGYPINSVGDDVFFTLAADGKYGFFSSEKDGGFGKQDLYMVTMPLAAKAPDLVLLKGEVSDEISGKPIEAKIKVTNNITREVVAELKSNSKTGKYMVSLPAGVNYNITIEKEGALFQSKNISLPENAGYKELVSDVKLLSVKKGANIVLNNIFFDTGKDVLKPESMEELDRLVKMLVDYVSIKIEISGHTDNRGDEKANVFLSQNRAKNVVNYLISKGIDAKRLTFKGYGSAKPLATNDNDENRQKNRRTEFLIIE